MPSDPNRSEPAFRLGILDQSPIPEDGTATDALRNSLDLAQLADGLGYHRYWVAEHHGTPGLACNSPEVLIGPLAATTRNLHIGSGGIMLPHYSPLKVSESFSMLAHLFPGRIDLGIGRAAGTSPNVAFALQRDRRQRAPDDFREQLQELLQYIHAAKDRELPFPSPWLLGSSPQSAVWAAELGLPYVFADFINPDGEESAAHYQRYFQPSQWRESPYTGIAVWAVCADTREEAEWLTLSVRMLMTLLHQGRLIAVPSPERARQFFESAGYHANAMMPRRRILSGTGAEVRAAIEKVARAYGAAEVLVVNILFDHQARRKSYELLAKAFDLSPAAAEWTATL